ncbi:MAG: hypothetical protein ACLFQQ_22920, partial [Desulfococcaceae bacterium]
MYLIGFPPSALLKNRFCQAFKNVKPAVYDQRPDKGRQDNQYRKVSGPRFLLVLGSGPITSAVVVVVVAHLFLHFFPEAFVAGID